MQTTSSGRSRGRMRGFHSLQSMEDWEVGISMRVLKKKTLETTEWVRAWCWDSIHKTLTPMYKLFGTPESLFKALRATVQAATPTKTRLKGSPVEFRAKVQFPHDPLISEKERVKRAAVDVWKAIGYRFTWVKAIYWYSETYHYTGFTTIRP
jgi:hypothetical protein